MKLNEVPKELLKESLLAIADLRRKYKGEEQVTAYAGQPNLGGSAYACPLCLFRHAHCESMPVEHYGCEECCPWYWIDGHSCEEYTNNQGDEESYDDFPIPDRLKRIDRWEAAINAEIANREATNDHHHAN